MYSNTLGVICIVWIIVLLVLYHKVFTVYYFDLGQGLLKEIVGAVILAVIMTALTLEFWWLSAIVIIFGGIGLSKKISNNIVITASVILAVIISVMGIKYKNEKNKNEDNKASNIEYENNKGMKNTNRKKENKNKESPNIEEYVNTYDYDDGYYRGFEPAVKNETKTEKNGKDNDIAFKQETIMESDINLLDSELYSAENSEDDEIDYSLWEDIYQRSTGPSSTIIISTLDDNGIVFSAGIGASGYLAYVDMREFYAEWIEEYTALYEDGSGYELYFVLNEDGSIDVTESVPYYSGLGLAGFYTKEAIADFPDCEFVFPQSSDSYISAEACEGLNELECKIARNEIYARHGRKFADEALQRYFDVCSWYHGTIEPEDFSANVLNNFELENLNIIGEYEIEMGYK